MVRSSHVLMYLKKDSVVLFLSIKVITLFFYRFLRVYSRNQKLVFGLHTSLCLSWMELKMVYKLIFTKVTTEKSPDHNVGLVFQNETFRFQIVRTKITTFIDLISLNKAMSDEHSLSNVLMFKVHFIVKKMVSRLFL